MIVVGLTGGIASGKSFVISYLKKKKIPTHESDVIIKKIYSKPSAKFLAFLSNNGFETAIKRKKIVKRIIRNEIFKNSKKKEKLEKYLHLEVANERKKFLKKNKNKKIVFLDIPLLFEKNLQFICDYVCSTTAPIYIRKKRALKRQGITEKIFYLILKNQTTDTKRKKLSDYLIQTNISKKKTYLKIDNIMFDIYKKSK